jgi:hypothetical protein
MNSAGCPGSTLVISGASTSVILKRCQLHCCSIAIVSGASATLDDCRSEGTADGLACVASGHSTRLTIVRGCIFTTWGQAVRVDGGAVVDMRDCVVRNIAWNGLLSCRAGTLVSLTGVSFQDIGGERSEEWPGVCSSVGSASGCSAVVAL